MIPTGASVRPLPRRKGPRGVRQVEVSPGRWMDEAVAEAQGIPLVYPLPSAGNGPVVVRREAPEVPPMPTAAPATAPTPRPPARGPGAPPTENQERAWLAVTERGLYWPDVARELGTTSWSVKNMIQAYMRRNGIPGEPPGRTPKDETSRRTMAAKGVTPKAARPAVPPPSATPAPVADRIVLAPEGHPWATDPEPIELGESGEDHAETIPAAIPDADPGHEMTAPTGGEPEPVASPEGTPGSPSPRTGGGGRGVAGDDFLSRIERELEALAREDADLLHPGPQIEARTAVASRIERLRTAGEVYRAVMAGRAA